MVEGQSELTDQEKNQAIIDGLRDTLLERIKARTINASEMQRAFELLEKLGHRYVSPNAMKEATLKRELPKFEDEGPIEFPSSVPMRRQA
jgi:hypothetical protein